MEQKPERKPRQEQTERTKEPETKTGKSGSDRRRAVLQKRNGRIGIMVAVVFLAVLAVITAGNLLHRDREYSENENRTLAQMPTLTAASLESGDFMQSMEDYVSDQFIFRDQWISLSVLENMALGIRESNGVYIGKKNYLFEISDEPNQTAIDNNLAAIRELAASHEEINTVMALVPNSIYILDQLTPTNAPVRDQSADIAYAAESVGSAVSFVNLIEPLSEHKEEYIYYKTDHHWTTLGARYAFEAMCQALQIEDPATEYDVYPVTHSFSGTLASTSGWHFGSDTIDIYVPRDIDSTSLVTYVDNGEKTASVYQSAALDTKNKYEVFLGGNYARIDINRPTESHRNLLIFKDSYANCLIPFLLPYYQNIIIIDARYSYDNVTSLINENSITDILILYNVNTFLTDTSLADVLEEDTDSAETSGADDGAEGSEEDAAAETEEAGSADD